MKKSSLVVGVVSSVALLLSASVTQADQVLSQNVVGYYNITVNPGLNLVAFPFQKIPAARGLIASATAGTITAAGAVWTPGEFAKGEVVSGREPGASTYYIEITDGGFEGRHMYIDANTADTLTIDGGLPLDVIDPAELNGAGFKIVAANRVRDLFGEPGSPALNGVSTALNSDNIVLWDGMSWEPAIFYKASGPGPQNVWRQGSITVDDKVVGRDQAMFVRRLGETEAVLTVVGEVSQNSQAIVLDSGLNLVGGLSVVSKVIGQAELENALHFGTTALNADNLIPWDGASWGTAVFYKDSGPGPQNVWRQGNVTVSDTFVIYPTVGYFIRVGQATPKGLWVRTSPLASVE